MMSTTTTTATRTTATRTKTTAGRQVEYFSPEGIKGRWAGEQPDGRAGGRGRRDNGRGDDPGGLRLATTGDFNAADYGSDPGYGADEFATGAYDLPDGADDDRPDRSRRRRKDREDRGERTGILRLRRDRGEDIWPDDGISDEDYWASVAADRPLNGTDSPVDNAPGAGGGNSRPGMDAARPARDARPGTGGADSRFGGEQRGGERGVTGRLGPPPGLAGDYKPGAQGSAGAAGGPGHPGGGRTGSGPMPARPSSSGPMPARPSSSGPMPAAQQPPARPASTGPPPTVGVTSSRPPAGQNGRRPGPAQPGTGSGGFRAARPAAVVPAERVPGRRRPGGRPSAGPQRLGPDGADRARQRLRLPRPPAKQPEPGPRLAPSGPGPPRRSRPPRGSGPGLPGAAGPRGGPRTRPRRRRPH